MKPPASRPRSQSQTRKTDDNEEIIFKTQGKSFNMTNFDRIYSDEAKYSL